MSGQLFIVSNRVPTDGPPSGGLVVALHDCLKQRGGTWIGTSGELLDQADDTLRDIPTDDYKIKVFDLTRQEHESYYLGYANSVLWPLCHRRTDLLDLADGYFDAYLGVNTRLAKMLAPLLSADDMVWIHDYHFLPLAACLRACGVNVKLGYFHHIPFPAPTDLAALPEQASFYKWISSFDLVGLQTQSDVATALDLFRRHPEGEQLMDGRILFKGRSFITRSFPIGIDADAFQQDAEQGDGRDMLHLAKDEQLVIGVDRLDYSKGLNNRLKAFGTYLENTRDVDVRTRFLQVAPPTREDVKAYQQIREEMEHTAGRLNGLYSKLGWTPIHYLHRPLARETLAALYRAADVAFVTPFADGMNLVAKEFVAAQNPDNPGVLILSSFAGAAEQLSDALIVNPHNTGAMAQALATALAMPLEERKARYNALRSAVFDENIAWWTQSYLTSLADVSSDIVVPALAS